MAESSHTSVLDSLVQLLDMGSALLRDSLLRSTRAPAPVAAIVCADFILVARARSRPEERAGLGSPFYTKSLSRRVSQDYSQPAGVRLGEGLGNTIMEDVQGGIIPLKPRLPKLRSLCEYRVPLTPYPRNALKRAEVMETFISKADSEQCRLFRQSPGFGVTQTTLGGTRCNGRLVSVAATFRISCGTRSPALQ